jgi:HpiC1 cyclase
MKHRRSVRSYGLSAIAVLTCVTGMLFVATPAEAQAVAIPILNSSFTFDTLSCNPGSNCNQYGITGWLTGPLTYIMKASTAQYPSAPPAGLYVAAIGNSSGTGSIFQTLTTTLQANMTYTLIVKVGARADYVFTGYQVTLLAGNVPLASGHHATPVGGTFVTDLVGYQSGAAPAQLGQPLQVLVTSAGTGQVNVANMVLTVQPTAE